MPDDCLFCRIVSGTIPSRAVYSDDRIYAFADVNPQAPLHVLLVPRRHIATLNDLQDDDDDLVGYLIRQAVAIAREEGYAEAGYRTVINCNRGAGQTVFHVHVHLLAGRPLSWPPG